MFEFFEKAYGLFAEIERLYHTQHYRSGDYCAKVNALHYLLKQEGII